MKPSLNNENNDLPLVGPRSHERSPAEVPSTELRLKDGTPVYYIFIDPETPVIKPHEVRMARNELARFMNLDRDAVYACQGKTAQEARAILAKIDEKDNSANAA